MAEVETATVDSSTEDPTFKREVHELEVWEDMEGNVGNVSVLLLLIKAHMRDEEASRRGNSVLHLATWYDSPLPLVEKLLSIGADPNRANLLNGFTTLHVAAVRSEPPIMKLLLDSKANVNALAKNGWTPLTFTLFRQKSPHDIIAILLSYGADPLLKALNGKSALEFAKEHQRDDLVAQMEKSIIMVSICSVHIPRLGRKSPLLDMPKELIRYLGTCLYPRIEFSQ